MITVVPLAEARVLIVGVDDLTKAILHDLLSYGVLDVTVLSASDASLSAMDEKTCRFIKKDPEQFIGEDSDYFKSFHLVLAANQTRTFELALSDARWPKDGKELDLDLPMIVMRSVATACKMRCQYRELPINGKGSSKFISLPMELLPWTDEKRALVASTIKREFNPEQNPWLHAYLSAARATISFYQSQGSWPGVQDKELIEAITLNDWTTDDPRRDDVRGFINQFCDGGLTSAHETIAILARLVSLDAVRLLTGTGQPINNTNIEEAICILADSW